MKDLLDETAFSNVFAPPSGRFADRFENAGLAILLLTSQQTYGDIRMNRRMKVQGSEDRLSLPSSLSSLSSPRVGGLFIKFAIIPERVDIAKHEMFHYKPGVVYSDLSLSSFLPPLVAHRFCDSKQPSGIVPSGRSIYRTNTDN